MDFPVLFEQIRELTEKDYRKIGLAGNPAYSELHRGDDIGVRIPREPLESEVKRMIDDYVKGKKTKHIYLFSREGGAGKSNTNAVMEEYCREKNLPFMHVDDEDVEEDGIEAIRYLIGLADVKKIMFFRQCDAQKGFYAKLLSIENAYIMGHGHNPDEELMGTNDNFKVFDLEEDYPFSHEQIYQLLKASLEKLTRKPLVDIPDDFLKKMSEYTTTPGHALNILGVCLAICAYKAKTGREPQITENDIRHCRWISHQNDGFLRFVG